MKKLFFIAIVSCNFLNAQPNLFPATGNVGIGTVNPTSPLTVEGTHTLSTILLHSTGDLANGINQADLMLWASEPHLTWTGVGIGNNVKNWNAATSTGGISRISNLRGGSYIRLLDNSMNFNLVSSSGADQSALTLISNGNVGIGTINPAQKLTVSGGHIGLDNKSVLAARNTSGIYENVLYGRWDNNATYLDGGTGGLYLRTNNGLMPNQFLSTNGNTGIGTLDPVQKLTVSGGNIGLDNQGTLAAKTTFGTYENVLYGRWINNATYLDGGAGGTYLRTANGTVINQYLSTNGNVGIGTINPAFTLDVVGTIRAREIRVNLGGADFVFEDGYKLMPLNELEKFVKQKKHLPEIAPAKEMQEKGGDVGNLTIQLLQKIEELTLHAIEQNKKLEQQNKKIEVLEAKMNNK